MICWYYCECIVDNLRGTRIWESWWEGNEEASKQLVCVKYIGSVVNERKLWVHYGLPCPALWRKGAGGWGLLVQVSVHQFSTWFHFNTICNCEVKTGSIFVYFICKTSCLRTRCDFLMAFQLLRKMLVLFKRAAHLAANERLCASCCCSANELRACHVCVSVCVWNENNTIKTRTWQCLWVPLYSLLIKMGLWKLNNV